jgi:hypothetical protein
MFTDVEETNDGGFIITGRCNKSALLLKTDEYGNEKWKLLSTGRYEACGYDVIETSDGSYCFVGSTSLNHRINESLSYSEIFTVKCDEDGNELWNDIYIPMADIYCDFNKGRFTISNEGPIGAYNISATSNITGRLLLRSDNIQETYVIALKPSENISIIPYMFGFGRVNLEYTITGLNVEKTTYGYDGFLLGFFFFMF